MDDTQSSHAISVNVYGNGDASQGHEPSHVGLAVYEIGSDKCQMHHVRIPDEEHFIYDPRFQPLRDPALWGYAKSVRSQTSRKI